MVRSPLPQMERHLILVLALFDLIAGVDVLQLLERDAVGSQSETAL